MKKAVKKIKLYSKRIAENRALFKASQEGVGGRITLQLRVYDEDGKYVTGDEYEGGNETIWLVGFDIGRAIEVVKSALLNSRHISDFFEVEK